MYHKNRGEDLKGDWSFVLYQFNRSWLISAIFNRVCPVLSMNLMSVSVLSCEHYVVCVESLSVRSVSVLWRNRFSHLIYFNFDLTFRSNIAWWNMYITSHGAENRIIWIFFTNLPHPLSWKYRMEIIFFCYTMQLKHYNTTGSDCSPKSF